MITIEIKLICHTSATVKSKIQTSRSLNREMIYKQFMSDDRDKINETTTIENCGRGLNAGQSPAHPPSKKASILNHSQEGFKTLEKGWHCSSLVKGFLGV